MNVRSKIWTFFLCAGIALFATSCFGATETTSSLTVEVGDTFTHSESIKSTFNRWEVGEYDVRKVSLIKSSPADTIGQFNFTFEALQQGQTQITLHKILETALTQERAQTHLIDVNIVESSVEPTTVQTQSTDEDASQSPPESEPEEPGPVGGDVMDEVRELMAIGRYDAAREKINTQISEASGNEKQTWRNLLAKTYMAQNQYQNAIDTWNKMAEQATGDKKAKWLHSAAKASMTSGDTDEAELVLLKIRHHHSGTNEWPKAMEDLAEIALSRDNPERARRLIDRARNATPGRNPDLTYRLAQIYDQYEDVRDYPKAVELYNEAASNFQNTNTDTAQKARTRANYLNSNYVDFGF